MEIRIALTLAVTMLCFQHALMEIVTNPLKDAIEDDGLIKNEMKISTKYPKIDATSLNNTLENNESDYLLKQDVEGSVKLNDIKSHKKKKGRLLRRKVLKKKFKPSHHPYNNNYYDGNMAYPIHTLQQQVFPTNNLSINSNSFAPEFSVFDEEQGLIDYFANKLASYPQPIVSEDMYYINAKNNQNYIFDQTQYNSTNTIQPQSYIDALDEKTTRKKRFFGGFMSGAVTVLEAAIKVNIPIPFCQFPNSPCKINFMK